MIEKMSLCLYEEKIKEYIRMHQFHKLSKRQLRGLLKGSILCETEMKIAVSECDICNITHLNTNRVYSHLFDELKGRSKYLRDIPQVIFI